MNATSQTDTVLAELREYMKNLGSVLIAFSGGTDSSLLVKVAVEELGDRVVALTGRSPFMPGGELESARRIAEATGVRHLVIDFPEMENAEFRKNPENRCYICKRNFLILCGEQARELGLEWVAEGTQKDELSGHRPGMQAVEELEVRSPYIDLGIDKEEIRRLSREFGLETWNKSSMACLATRFPTGVEITEERLGRVERCEAFLRVRGFRTYRVRFHGEEALLELDQSEIPRMLDGKLRDLFVTHCRKLGFERITLDLRGYGEKGD